MNPGRLKNACLRSGGTRGSPGLGAAAFSRAPAPDPGGGTPRSCFERWKRSSGGLLRVSEFFPCAYFLCITLKMEVPSAFLKPQPATAELTGSWCHSSEVTEA